MPTRSQAQPALLPLVQRELRAAARLSGTYWGRTGAALGAAVLAAWVLLVMGDSTPVRAGQILFFALAGCAFLYCLLAGLRATSDCLSAERRDGTLGLLFLTDLRAHDVVLGKLAATSLGTVYALVAMFPVMSIVLPLGGVSSAELARVILTLCNTMLLSLASGLFVSAIWLRPQVCAGMTFLILLAINGLMPMIGLITSLRTGTSVGDFYLTQSAVCAMFTAFDGSYAFAPKRYWISTAYVHGWTWILTGLSCLAAARSWQDKPAGSLRVRWRERWKQWALGRGDIRAGFRRRLLDANPILWLAARDRLKPFYAWIVLGAGAAFWMWISQRADLSFWNEGTLIFAGLILNSGLKCMIGLESGQLFFEGRRSQAFELVLATPLRVKDILHGQLLALRRQFGGPVLAASCLNLTALAWGLWFSADLTHRAMWAATWVGATVFLVLDGYTLAWVGMWQGVLAKQANRIAGATIVRVLILPWIAHGFILVGSGILIQFGVFRSDFEPTEWMNLWLWVGLGLAIDGYYIWRARRFLLQRFRGAASARYSPAGAPGAWNWVRRMFARPAPDAP